MRMNREDVKDLKKKYKEGMKVELYNMAGEDMPIGLEGTVKLVDDIGQIHVKWDNGSTLALNAELDTFSII